MQREKATEDLDLPHVFELCDPAWMAECRCGRHQDDSLHTERHAEVAKESIILVTEKGT